MSDKSSGCGCCPECTGGPDCTCGCPECKCVDHNSDCCCDCGPVGSKFVLSAVSSIVGMLFFGLLALLLAITYLNDAYDFTTIVANDLTILMLIVVAVLGIAGLFSLKAGDLTEGLMFSLVGLVFFVSLAAELHGFGTISYMSWILVLVLVIAFAILLAGRDTTFGIAVILFTLGFVFELAFSGNLVNIISGLAYLFAGILLLYIAISDWIYVETGEDLPIL